MTTAVRLQVRNLDLEDESLDDGLGQFENATFSQVDGLGFMTVYVEDQESVVDTVLEAARKIGNLVQDASATRVHPDLVTTSDIARRVGVSREAVRKWAKETRQPFPTQFDNISDDHQRVWRWVEVVEWLLSAKSIKMDEDLPSLGDIAHIDACLSKVPDVVSQDWATAQTGDVSFMVHPTSGQQHLAQVTDIRLYRRQSFARETVSSAV
jgi:transcriptional regulator with XRE-family HTH domain